MRYFFDLLDGTDLVPDEIGLECAGLEHARTEAIVALTEMARDRLPDSGDRRDLCIVVREGDRRLLLISVTYAVRQLLGPR